ncbi:MAG: hypothetical protein J7L31_00610 [Thermoplasmata archaeon]|nr:hypothetical protein [Thermoplasmata archaeon]
MAKEFILPEFSLEHEEKKKMEKEYFEGYEDFLTEKRWEKRAKESLKDIERAIDEGLERKAKGAKAEEAKEGVEREIIYSSKRGFIVKVTYNKEDESRVAYYLVTKIEDIEEALDMISSYKPLIEEGEGKELFGL